MAGMPKRKLIVERIEMMGGEEGVIEGIMEGKSLLSICRTWGVSRGMMYWWLHRDDERWKAFEEARRLGAYAMADDIHDLEEGMTDTSVFVDRERVRIKQWLAERANRAAFGKDSGNVQIGVVISASDLHLQAHEASRVEALPVGEAVSLDDMLA